MRIIVISCDAFVSRLVFNHEVFIGEAGFRVSLPSDLSALVGSFYGLVYICAFSSAVTKFGCHAVVDLWSNLFRHTFPHSPLSPSTYQSFSFGWGGVNTL